jgi:uncharacterized protein (DUF885 family)
MIFRLWSCAGYALFFAVLAGAVVLLAAQQNSSAQSQAPDAALRQQQLQALFKEEWEYELRSRPEMATALGDHRYDDQLGDDSPAFHESDVRRRRDFLGRFEHIAPDGLPAQEALSRELMIRGLREDIEGAEFKPWEMPVSQMDGPHLWLIDLTTMMPFHTSGDYENYLARLRQIPGLFEQVTANMRQGMRDKLMPPRYLLEKVAVQSQAVADEMGEASPFAKPVEQFPADIPSAEQKRLRAATLKAINTEVVPAYEKFAKFVRAEYAPHGRSEPGVWALPDGDARYRFAIRQITTTDLTPDQIHEIGLQQIAKTEKEMLALAHKLGFQDLASLNAQVKADRSLYATSGGQLLDLYSKYSRQMEARLPQYFGRLPKNKLIVIPMDSFRAKNAVPADYTAGAADGSRPGRINVNEWDPTHRLLLNVEAIAYHEGVPGHHLQISLAQELPDLPDFRRNGQYTAFVEGWALYSESLAKEMGFYQDPYSDYGRLENEMWRDIRLVIDTGVHEKHWSRDQMVDYFHRFTAMDEPNVQTEVDRYIAWPGQALAYKLGQLEILKLRAEARQKLGNKFDIRAFHDEILGRGPLPLDVLQSRLEAWIAGQSSN